MKIKRKVRRGKRRAKSKCCGCCVILAAVGWRAAQFSSGREPEDIGSFARAGK